MKNILLIAFPFLCVIGLWAASGFALYGDPNRGSFGDMFGAINALFSGLAFAGLIYAVLLQREELSLQRMELRETRAELQRAAAAQEKAELSTAKLAMFSQSAAKISSLSSLLGLCSAELDRLGYSADQRSPRHQHKINRLLERQKQYQLILEEIFDAANEGVDRAHRTGGHDGA
jgi:hypothetical protein